MLVVRRVIRIVWNSLALLSLGMAVVAASGWLLDFLYGETLTNPSDEPVPNGFKALVVFALLVLPFLRWRTFARERQLKNIGRCPTCGYDRRASPERCPECGTVAATANA